MKNPSMDWSVCELWLFNKDQVGCVLCQVTYDWCVRGELVDAVIGNAGSWQVGFHVTG